ncbi:unnamed protein product [Calicophoron daubneyi]|uniref:G-protein coupled receptors family 1 profile domain-containing protein n=1 Tax=Calicophoron daubneyi TaxID=300641 RepID=A0AAV2TIE9_CALDB
MQRHSPCRFNMYVISISFSQTMEIIFNAMLDDFFGRGLYWLSDCKVKVKLDTTYELSCKLINYIPEATALISTSLLALFSIDRVFTVYKPLKFRGDLHRRVAGFAIVGIFVLGFLLNLPQMIQSGLVETMSNVTLSIFECQYKDSRNIWAQYVLYLSIIGSTILPSVFVFICNVLIFLKLRSLFRERSRLCASEERNSAELRRVVGHLAFTTLFFFNTLPIIVLIILRQQSDFNNYSKLYPEYAQRIKHLSRLFSSFESLNSVTAFPTYFIFLPSFRAQLNCLATCGQNKPKPHQRTPKTGPKHAPPSRLKNMPPAAKKELLDSDANEVRHTLLSSLNSEDEGQK